MDLQQMRYVLAVVDTGGFTAAARQCLVAQPSLSQSVANLERELGVQLFQRIGRGVVVTAAGSAFASAARVAVRAADNVRVEVDAVAGVLAGSLDLVALPTLALEPVTPMVGAFRAAHPQVLVRLAHPDGMSDLLRSIMSGASEIGITVLEAGRVRPRGFVSHRLGEQEIVVVLPPGSSAPVTMSAAALARLPLITNPLGTSMRGLLDSLLAEFAATQRIAIETDQREAIIPLVLAGAGAALLPRPMAEWAARQGAVVVALAQPTYRALVLVHRDAELSPAARAFLGIARPFVAATSAQ